jgi:sigma-B regulation protein RsbU (phosphoserine phosphatase)
MAFAMWKKDGAEAKQHAERVENRTSGMLNFVVLLATGAVAYTDWAVVSNVSLGYLYVLPLALCAVVNRLPVTVGLAASCTFLSDIFGPPADTLKLRIVHNVVYLVGFLVVAVLVTSIVRQRDRLAARVKQQRDEYENDLKLAAQVQQQVLPKPIRLPDVEIAGAMHPARLLGGDYYDFFPISDDVIDVVIADVSGKGAAAALLMPSLAVALRLRARELSGPAEIMKDLDGVLKQVTKPATFVTMFYARLNRKSKTLEYACGGHNPPLLVRHATEEAMLLEGDGPILGILPDAQFSNAVVSMAAGDFLTLYTDGVTEQENDASEQFSMERLKAVLLKDADEGALQIVNAVGDAVSGYAGGTEQEDDLTVVVVKILS